MLANNSNTVHPRVLRFLSWLSLCALAQHWVTRTKNFLTRACPAPAPSTTCTRPAASSTRTRMQSSAGSCTCPATTGTRNLSGLTRPAQDSCTYLVEFSRSRIFEAARTFFEVRTIGGRGRSGACHTQLHSLSPFYWQRDDDAATRHNLIGQYLLFYYCVWTQ